MTYSDRNDVILEEARLLLPWYLTEQLSTKEKDLINEALILYPNLKDELIREEHLRKLVHQDAYLLELAALDTTPQRLENLWRRIDREAEVVQTAPHTLDTTMQLTGIVRNNHTATPSLGLKQRINQWLDNVWTFEWLTPANAVLATLLVCQMAVGSFYWYQSEATSYQLASSQSADINTKNADKSPLMIVIKLREDSTIQELNHFMMQYQAELVGGSDDGSFKLTLTSLADKASLDTLVAEVNNKIKTEPRSPMVFIGKYFDLNNLNDEKAQ